LHGGAILIITSHRKVKRGDVRAKKNFIYQLRQRTPWDGKDVLTLSPCKRLSTAITLRITRNVIQHCLIREAELVNSYVPESCSANPLEKVALIIDFAFKNPKTLRIRDFYAANTGEITPPCK